mmetsp:Transcript_17789/g.42831  ORF Transcript_17789/g.42831 Transcript_17789/m.42831 type:complete len:81 (+) Transcript_17789:1532-1774(+)
MRDVAVRRRSGVSSSIQPARTTTVKVDDASRGRRAVGCFIFLLSACTCVCIVAFYRTYQCNIRSDDDDGTHRLHEQFRPY